MRQNNTQINFFSFLTTLQFAVNIIQLNRSDSTNYVSLPTRIIINDLIRFLPIITNN